MHRVRACGRIYTLLLDYSTGSHAFRMVPLVFCRVCRTAVPQRLHRRRRDLPRGPLPDLPRRFFLPWRRPRARAVRSRHLCPTGCAGLPLVPQGLLRQCYRQHHLFWLRRWDLCAADRQPSLPSLHRRLLHQSELQLRLHAVQAGLLCLRQGTERVHAVPRWHLRFEGGDGQPPLPCDT